MTTASMMTTNPVLPRAPRPGRCQIGAGAAPAFGLEAAPGLSLMPFLEQDAATIPQRIHALLDGIALLHWFEGCETPRHPDDFSLDAQGTPLPRSVSPSSAEWQIEICLNAQQWLQCFVYPGGPTLCFWWNEGQTPLDAPSGLSRLRDVLLFPDLRAALTGFGEQAGMSGSEFAEELRRTGRLDAINDARVTAALAPLALSRSASPYGLMTPETPALAPAAY